MSLNSQTYLGHNQEAYQELRLALQLNLRRQLLIAVCDDVALQEQLAQRLEANFSPLPETVPLAPEVRARQFTLVTLRLGGDRPDLVREVLLWLKQQRRLQSSLPTTPVFQIVGIDQLTRQSPTVQNRFLASLIRVDALLTQLDCRLLVWVPRPWLGKIRQSVPGFWRSRSGLFEFAGEPSPLPAPIAAPATKLNATPATASPATESPGLWRVLRDDLSTFEPPIAPAAEETPPAPAPQHKPVTPPNLPTLLDAAARALEPPQSAQPQRDTVSQGDNVSQGYVVHTHGTSEQGVLSSVIMPPVGATAAETLAALQRVEPILPAPAAAEAAPSNPEGRSPAAALQLPPDLAQDAELVNLWRYVQGLIDQQAGPMTLARAYLALGQMGRDRLAVDAPAASVLDFAMAVYDRAIAGLPEGSTDWCDALNDLASLYWLQGQQAGMIDPAPWLRRSAQTYEKALQDGRAIPADTLGRIAGNLGTVYGLLANLEDPVPCLEKAVTAYQTALEHSPAALSPIDYANLQNSLGAIHWRLAQHDDPQHHLPLAIAAYSEALAHRTAAEAPIEYAMVQNNLGIAYWSLAQHQQPVFLLERAIVAYRAALQYRTPAAAPAGCAATANNLGTAYWDLAQQVDLRSKGQTSAGADGQSHAPGSDDRLNALQQAVAAYEMALMAAETALQESPPPTLGFDLWATCHSAGVVHDQLAQALPEAQTEAREHHLDAALRYYLLAYEGWRDSPHQLEVLLTALVYNAHLTFEIFGIPGQQAVLSKLPGELLPQVLRRL
ncbi:tetratricopeptide repeat protein [Nodosilinea sp. LEGE 06152]|uniref:tetratricopeptide repeat protein n=1 Tax=Nodosilinea sp. LEGE 06152 TaxID=2777966 RepID=UPI001881A420|nr:tetratricopeptide repeat protein [Nodosilinea sp. LEGE 06152]MBE9155278.1 tetratricopeptide repeat protein [Nodosilinea sp. LEGE 06152]